MDFYTLLTYINTKFKMRTMVNLLCLLIFGLLLWLDGVRASDQLMICRNVNKVFSNDSSEGSDVRRTQGSPGKRGPPGMQGDRGRNGPIGPPGIVDYGRVNSTIDEKVQPVISGLCEQKNSLDNRLDHIEAMLKSLPGKLLKKRGLCQLEHNGICYWVVSHPDWDLTYSQAQAICDNNGGKAANIYTEEQFAKTMVFLRTKTMVNKDHVNVWTGMRKTPTTNAVTTDNGIPAPTPIWHQGRPTSSTSYDRIAIVSRISTTTSYHGLVDYPEAHKIGGVLCEIQSQ